MSIDSIHSHQKRPPCFRLACRCLSWFLLSALTLDLGLSAQASPAQLQTQLTQTLTQTPTFSHLPSQVAMGAATIHRYTEPKVAPSSIAITVWVPMGSSDLTGQLININTAALPSEAPTRWMIGDGGKTRSFVGIDMTEGSVLRQSIEYLYQEAINSAATSQLPIRDRVLLFARDKMNEYVAWTEGAVFNDGRPELPWDLAIPALGDLSKAFTAAGPMPIFHYPVDSGKSFPVVGLERYLAIGKGYCLQKALTASLLLSRAGISHRLVNGAVSQAPGISVGHTWIELEDGQVLDVAWSLIEKPLRGHPDHSEWIYIGGRWRFANTNYLIFAL